MQNPLDIKAQLEHQDLQSQLFIKDTHDKIMQFLHQAHYLTQQYDCVIANPPYMGSKYHIKPVKDFLKHHYKGYEKDLFSAFMVRCFGLGKENSQLGFVTPYVWMFISSYEKLRNEIIENHTLTTLIQLEYNAFAPACIPVCAFTVTNPYITKFKGTYIRLSDFKGSENQGPKTLEAIKAERARLEKTQN